MVRVLVEQYCVFRLVPAPLFQYLLPPYPNQHPLSSTSVDNGTSNSGIYVAHEDTPKLVRKRVVIDYRLATSRSPGTIHRRILNHLLPTYIPTNFLIPSCPPQELHHCLESETTDEQIDDFGPSMLSHRVILLGKPRTVHTVGVLRFLNPVEQLPVA